MRKNGRTAGVRVSRSSLALSEGFHTVLLCCTAYFASVGGIRAVCKRYSGCATKNGREIEKKGRTGGIRVFRHSYDVFWNVS